MKKTLFVFSLISLLLALTLGAQAATVIDGGTVGHNVKWTIDSDGTLSFTGEGVIPNYAIGTQPWRKYQDGNSVVIKKLVVGEGITRIGSRALQNCYSLSSVELSDTVEYIGSYAFQNCRPLESIDVAEGVQFGSGFINGTPAVNNFETYRATNYWGSVYHKRVSAVELTGNYRKDIVKVALSQLGYHEGAGPADYDGSHPSSSDNYTEFNRVVSTYTADWCSEFYLWCARMAGVPTNILNRSTSATANSWLSGTKGKYYTWSETIYGGGDFVPQPGDLLQWQWDLDEYGPGVALSHTSMFNGLTVNGDGTVTVHSIDGNVGSRVKLTDYILDYDTGHVHGKAQRLYYIIAPDYEEKLTKVTKYTVSFSCEGMSYPDKTVAELGQYGALPFPEREGDRFIGWYTAETGGELVNRYTAVNLSGPQTLYARWESDEQPAAAAMAKQSKESITLNGSTAVLSTFQLLDADGNATNYVRLRDVAALLDGTAAQFDVSWNGKVLVSPKTAYVSRTGTEGVSPFNGAQPYETLGDSISVGGADRMLNGIVLTDAEGGGHTYFKLRDIAAECGFAVDWQQGTGIIINA
ncbi:MAG: leucine-rich repeat protein [Oscillospiraceae bacterium]|nr:leucine-rich repeat protein [Oscillospiraceae bacterium]